MPDKKTYQTPAIVMEREIEALTGICLPLGQDTGNDKLTSAPPVCLNPIT